MKSLALKVILILGLLLALALLYRGWEKRVRADEAEKVTARLTKSFDAKLRTAESKANQELQTLRTQHAQNLQAIDVALDRSLRELRQRPSRSAPIPQPPAHCPPAAPACTGSTLAREDAEFLTRESAGAAQQQAALISATKAYNTCARTLEEVTNGTPDKASNSPRVQP